MTIASGFISHLQSVNTTVTSKYDISTNSFMWPFTGFHDFTLYNHLSASIFQLFMCRYTNSSAIRVLEATLLFHARHVLHINAVSWTERPHATAWYVWIGIYLLLGRQRRLMSTLPLGLPVGGQQTSDICGAYGKPRSIFRFLVTLSFISWDS
jgi:hypothetical protein